MSSVDTPAVVLSEKGHPLTLSRTPSTSKKSATIDIEGVSRDCSSEITDEDKAKHKKSKRQSRIALIHLCTVSVTLFNLGWNDGTSGPLLPRLQSVYDIEYTIVSLLFILSCGGFVTGAFLNVWLNDIFGMGKMMIIGAVMQLAAYSVQASAPPFPAFVAMGFINGMGLAFQDAQANGYIGSSSENVSMKMGVAQCFYGLGAFLSAIVSTQFANKERWSFHYLVSLGFAVINTILVIVVFRGRRMHDNLRAAGETAQVIEKKTTLREIVTSPTVHLLSFFLFAYVGLQISIGGWITTFIREVRHGGPDSGYISSGYFGALAVGRVILLPINAYFGERNVIYIYALITLALDFVVWFVPSLVGNGVAVGFMGLFLAPMYPLAMNHASRVLPQNILTASIGWMAAWGQAGAAIVPFIAGAISENHGIKSLNPLAVAFTGAVFILWLFVPTERQRK